MTTENKESVISLTEGRAISNAQTFGEAGGNFKLHGQSKRSSFKISRAYSMEQDKYKSIKKKKGGCKC